MFSQTGGVGTEARKRKRGRARVMVFGSPKIVDAVMEGSALRNRKKGRHAREEPNKESQNEDTTETGLGR